MEKNIIGSNVRFNCIYKLFTFFFNMNVGHGYFCPDRFPEFARQIFLSTILHINLFPDRAVAF